MSYEFVSIFYNFQVAWHLHGLVKKVKVTAMSGPEGERWKLCISRADVSFESARWQFRVLCVQVGV